MAWKTDTNRDTTPGRDWLAPERLPELPVTGGNEPVRFELRPLSLGEILDRTFALYRSRFWLFAGISMVPAAVQVAVQAISWASSRALMRNFPVVPVHPGGPAPAHLGVGAALHAQIGAYLALLVFFLVAAVTQAATSLAMSEVYLSQPASAAAALGAAARRWYRWIGIALWMAGSMLWLPLVATVPGALLVALGTRGGNSALTVIGGVLIFAGVFGGFPVGFLFYIRNALAIPAGVVERLTIRPAMRRSKVLAAGTKGRIFTVLLIAACLYLVVGVLESPASFLMMAAPRQAHYLAEAITLVISFVGRTLVAPVALIGLTLVYFDQRVRKEALDLQLLLEGSRETVAATTSSLHPGGAAPLA